MTVESPEPRSSGWRGPGPMQLVILLLVAGLVGGVIATRLNEPEHPGVGSVDVGFLYDMTTHHSQAIAMSLAYLRNGEDPQLQHLAREIVTSQASEVGWFNLLLTQWHQDGAAPKSMAWMDMAHAGGMPGLAPAARVAGLDALRGRELDDEFSRLMIAHHRGGAEMAGFAGQHAQDDYLRDRATAMAAGQRSEIGELNAQRTRLGLEPS